MPADYHVKTEGGKKYLVIDCRSSPYGPSIADYPQRMAEAIQYLGKTDADVLVLAEVYERVYDEEQTSLLKEISDLIRQFRVKGVWAGSMIKADECNKPHSERHDTVVNIASDLLRTDPVKAYVKLLKILKRERNRAKKLKGTDKKCSKRYIKTLEYIKSKLEATELIQRLKKYLRKLKEMPSGRTIYHSLFEAQLKPSFIGSRLVFELPEEIELVDQYTIKGSEVKIYKHPEKVEYLYHIDPPEYSLSPEHYFLMSKTKERVSTYHPEGMKFTDISKSTDYFKRIYETTITDIANQNDIEISPEETSELAGIVARYTIGFGIMGLLLSDQRLTDVYMDAPLGQKPVYVVHGDYGSCQTNVIFSHDEAESIVSRFRSLSGRPFDEAHPVLDMDLVKYHTRVATIGQPLSPDGIAFALRIHKETPWTLPQFIEVDMVSWKLAGLLSYLIDAQASTLVTGSRGAGKSSLMMSLMLEILPSLRIITIEDTLEIPVGYMRKIGFNIQRLKTRSPISAGAIGSEVSPSDALRTALRLGDSCLIMGEVRSKEAQTLYEAMRVGAVGNVVMGTIHGESAYSVWDRIVNDLDVPTTSFKATDCVVVCAPVRFKGSIRRHRRVVQVTEVGKKWKEDPEAEGGFTELMDYTPKTDSWHIKKDTILNNSPLFDGLSDERGMSKERIWADILHRGKAKRFLVDMKQEYSIPDLLEAKYTVRANDKYTLIQENMRRELGNVDYDRALDEWKDWVKQTLVKELVSRKKAEQKAGKKGE